MKLHVIILWLFSCCFFNACGQSSDPVPGDDFLSTSEFVRSTKSSDHSAKEIAEMLINRAISHQICELISAAAISSDTSGSQRLYLVGLELKRNIFEAQSQAAINMWVSQMKLKQASSLILFCQLNNIHLNQIPEEALLNIFNSEDYGRLMMSDNGRGVIAFLREIESLEVIKNKDKISSILLSHSRIVDLSYKSDPYEIKKIIGSLTKKMKK